MRYVVRLNVLMQVPELEIAEADFSMLRAARGNLVAAFSLEETYELLVSSFLDFEEQVLRSAVRNSIQSQEDYIEFFGITSVLNGRMVNFLSSARLYLDQAPRLLAICCPSPSSAVDTWRLRTNQEFDEHPEYQFMEALRNHVQHHGLPVHSIKQGGTWSSSARQPDARMEYRLSAFARRDLLEANDKFKQAALTAANTEIDLKIATRRYMESLSAIHQCARDLLKIDAAAARTSIEMFHQRYKEAGSESLIGLTAFAYGGENEQTKEEIPLLLEWDNIRLKLQRRNRELINLSKRYASGA